MVFSHDPASRPADDPFEKKPVTDYLQDQSPSLGENDEIDWTAEEEKKLVRKYAALDLRAVPCHADAARLDMVVMPLLVLGFYALQLDRGNMYVLPLRSLCFSY